MKTVVPFAKARETSLYGSKAVGLGEAAREGLPVPPGVALSGDLVEAVASGEDNAIEKRITCPFRSKAFSIPVYSSSTRIPFPAPFVFFTEINCWYKVADTGSTVVKAHFF